MRAAGECPPALQPLIELQYRGRVWHQPNGYDWTVRAFLASSDGLGLDIAADRRTEEALLRALPLLADIDARALKSRRLDADDFDKLAVGDTVRDLLLWLNNPEIFEAGAKGARWESFRALCQSEFGVDPEQTPAAEIAALLLQGETALDRVWARFCEAPQLYPGLAKLLHNPAALKQGSLVLDPSRDPKINQHEEHELRSELESAAALPHVAACERVLELEARHASRREWVWARMNLSPWTRALIPLSRLADCARNPLGETTLSAAAAAYAANGWQCDRAAMDALACSRSGPDRAVMSKLVRALYEPWLDTSARHFQALVASQPDHARKAVGKVVVERDTCVLFVDGLRFNLAGNLVALLEERSLRVTLAHRFAPLPTVTPTAKPAASPIPDGIRGADGGDFTPLIQNKSAWKPLAAPLFRERLESLGIEILDSSETRIPSGSNSGAWTEMGSIDRLGHDLQGELVHQLETEIGRIAERIIGLLESGWRRVRVVTDHGWLLLAGGLPKVDLAAYLVETKCARCAVVRGRSEVTVPVSTGHWNADVRIASPPGIACFRIGQAYAHGGISPQECVIPDLVVERGMSAAYAKILSIEWRGMRCRVRVETNEPRTRVDLRKNWKQDSTSIVASVKEVGASGEVSLTVSDDRYEGEAASVVVIDPEGRILASQTTCVGEKS